MEPLLSTAEVSFCYRNRGSHVLLRSPVTPLSNLLGKHPRIPKFPWYCTFDYHFFHSLGFRQYVRLGWFRTLGESIDALHNFFGSCSAEFYRSKIHSLAEGSRQVSAADGGYLWYSRYVFPMNEMLVSQRLSLVAKATPTSTWDECPTAGCYTKSDVLSIRLGRFEAYQSPTSSHRTLNQNNYILPK